MATYTYIPRSAGNPTIQWNANTEPDLAGYRVYYGTSSDSYNPAIDVGNVTSYTFSGLLPNTTYYFAVTAYDTSNNESTFSDEISLLVWRQVIVSGAATSSARHQWAYQGSSGAVTGGTASKSRRKVPAVTGGLVTGGSGLSAFDGGGLFVYTGSGSIITGGTDAHSRTIIAANPTGGLVAGGAATVVQAQARVIYIYNPSAGVALAGGTATRSRLHDVTPTGAAVVSGSATTSYIPVTSTVYAYTASGAAVAGGGSTQSKRKVKSATGSAVTGGAASYRFFRRRRGKNGATASYIASGSAVTSGAGLPSKKLIRTASGGITLGGAVDSQFRVIVPRTFFTEGFGILQTGGTPDRSFTKLYDGSGVLTTGGVGQVILTSATSAYNYTGNGVANTGGAATPAVTLIRSASGGITLSGDASTFFSQVASHSYFYAASGFIQTSGAADLSKTLIREGGGVAITSGAAASIVITGETGNAVFEYDASGSIVMSMEDITYAWTLIREGSGGIVMGGDPGDFSSGDVSFTPGVSEEFGCPPFRLFQRDCEIAVKGWGSEGAYMLANPFGGKHHREPSGAEI